MIKLNSKNITYVALADTNNSLKAPKEIWYADSNNSVKLVYQRKDALIEGEDYEKYHWLVGDADAYINTLKNYRPYDDSVQMTFRDNLYPNRESKYNKYNKEEQIWGACETNNLQSILIRSYVSGGSAPNSFCNNIIDGNTADSAVSWGIYATQNYINESPEHSLYISSVNNEDRYYFIYNGNTKNNLPTRYTLPELVQQDVRIFYSGIYDNGCFNGSFFNFIHYRNNVEITHLIPCKLLKPIPKWLDANGIRRQVGECGMIDLVSGKFYGNVNSVGTFTVENYYEKKEWLVGDGTAYIDTLRPNGINDVIRFKANVKDLVGIKGVFGNHIMTNNRQSCFFVTYNKDSFATSIFQQNSEIYPSRTDDIEVQINQDKVIVNETDYSIERSGSISNYSMPIFTRRRVTSEGDNIVKEIAKLSLNYFAIDGVMYLTPCRLLHPIPASLDANGKSRAAGECGMWDKVSNKFYGNVASSGTFKAVNLAEGVDYEVHQWLIVEIPKRTYMCYLPVNSSSFEFKCKFFTPSNCGYFSTEGYTYYKDSGAEAMKIWSVPGTYGWASQTTVSDGDLIEIISSPSETTINGESVPQKNFPITSIKIYQAANATRQAIEHISSITVDGIERYIPVKLLRSIPAKYDANGIARNAGECGMYDTVNDVFYGNVASSGSFTVEDDS